MKVCNILAHVKMTYKLIELIVGYGDWYACVFIYFNIGHACCLCKKI